MAYASRSGRARTSASNPQAFAVCQRCGQWYNRVDLNFQFDWRGAQLQNLYILVCKHCMDRPQEQLRAITLPADPVPIYYPSVEDFDGDSSDYRAVTYPTVTDPITGIPVPSTVLRVTQDCQNRTLIPYGEIPYGVQISKDEFGLDQNAVMPQQGSVAYGVVLPVLSIYSVGCNVTVTCSAPHGLQPGNQVSVSGLQTGNGFFSVGVPTATAFTYVTEEAVNPQLQPGFRFVNTNVGLPRGYEVFPIPPGRIGESPNTAPGPPVITAVIAL
jgi:hypothetical protein